MRAREGAAARERVAGRDGDGFAGVALPRPDAAALARLAAGSVRDPASTAGVVALERARLALEVVRLGERGRLDLHLGPHADLVIEQARGGVMLAMSAHATPSAAARALASLAAVVEARGVPVVRAEVRGGGAGRHAGDRRAR